MARRRQDHTPTPPNSLLRYSDPSQLAGHITRDDRITPRNFWATGWGSAGAVLCDSRPTPQVEEPSSNRPTLFRPFARSIPHRRPFRVGMRSLAGRLGFGRIPTRDQLRH